jgi:hypothetical protein
MGNQREIRQLLPFVVRWGAAIPIRGGQYDLLLSQHDRLHDYRMLVQRSQGTLRFPNLDYEDANVRRLGDYLCLQSGHKMWCGYEQWVAFLSDISPSLLDATFYVGDELGFIDRFDITKGHLDRERVHDDEWISLDRFPSTRIQVD